MAKQTQNALTTQGSHSIGAEIKFDKNDLVTVAVSKAERKMQAELKTLNLSIKSHEKAVKDNNAAVDAIATKQAKDELGAAGDALVAAMNLIEKGHRCEITGSFNLQANSKEVCCCVEVSDKQGSREFYMHKRLKPNAELREILSQNADYEKQLTGLRAEAVEWRRKLASIGTLERQFRAKLVEAELNKSDLGKELLANLEVDWEQAVLQLPGV